MKLRVLFSIGIISLTLTNVSAQLKAVLVKDINLAGNATPIPSLGNEPNYSPLKIYKGKLHFIATDEKKITKTWLSDGTTDGTKVLAEIPPASIITIYKDKFVYNALDTDSIVKLFISDGTAAGTTMLYNQKLRNYLMRPQVVEYKDELYFISSDNKLMKSDGTSAGTAPVTSVYDAEFLTVFNGKLYFAANGFNHFLMESDGTEAGTKQVTNVNPSSDNQVSFLKVSQGKLFFQATYKSSSNRELYVSDGTAAGTKFIKDLNNKTGFGNGSNPRYFNDLNGKTIFFTDDGLWSTDGTEAGTVLIKALSFSSPLFDAEYNPVVIHNNIIYFNARAEGNTDFFNSVWRTDGTPEGTKKIAPSVGVGADIVPLGDKIYITGDELFSYQESTGTFKEEVDIFPGGTLDRGYPREMVNLGGTLYFWATDGSKIGYELYKVVVEGPLTASIAQIATIKCNGDKTATIKATTTGGISPFTYLWSNGATTEEITGLGEGNYSVTITGKDNKTSIATTTITEPSKITLTTTSKASNPQYKNGNAVVTASGGTPPYTYLWNTVPAQKNEVAKNLVPGNYTATVTDINSCKSTVSVTVALSTSNNEIWDKYSFELFPNPTSDYLNIKFDGITISNATLNIIDLNGKIVMEQSLNSNMLQINIAQLPVGMYNLRCQINPQEIATSTFIIQR
jgi:ELWxxDGT repeat protein